MNERSFLKSLNDAVEGFIYTVREERNMRVHFLIAFFVLLVGIFLSVNRLEWIILCITATLVLVAEMVNTAIEETVDLLVGERQHETARLVKHVSAGAVLVAVCNSLIVAAIIFSRYWSDPFSAVTRKIRYSPWQVSFAALAVSVFLVIAGKAFAGKGTPLRGGPLSGHTAVAFSIWTAVLFMRPTDLFTVTMTFLLAAFVAQSRVKKQIHSVTEILAGAIVGIAVTALFFKIFIH